MFPRGILEAKLYIQLICAAGLTWVVCLVSRLRYVEEHVQKTGVAIETQGFTFVTSGRKRESLTVSNRIFCECGDLQSICRLKYYFLKSSTVSWFDCFRKIFQWNFFLYCGDVSLTS